MSYAPLRRMAKVFLARKGFRLARVADDPSLGDLLARVFADQDINCVLDVGAHTGGYARFLRAIGYRGHIVSFEPVRSSFEVLAEVAANDPRWRVLPFALGERSGEASINLFPGSTFHSFLNPSSYGLGAFASKLDKHERETIQIKRLAEVMDECLTGISSPRIFLKMDTQGYDLSVVEGADPVLDRVLGLQTELALLPIYQDMRTTLAQALPQLQGRGFDVAGLFPVTRDSKDALRIIELDCVMIRSRERPASRVDRIPS